MFKRFENAVTVALKNKKIKKKYPQRTIKNKPFINKYNQEGINFISEKDDLKKYEESNVTIALNVLYAKKEKTYPAYISKHNSNREKQVIPLLIPNEEKWHYLAVKKLSALLGGITPNIMVVFIV